MLTNGNADHVAVNGFFEHKDDEEEGKASYSDEHIDRCNPWSLSSHK